MKACAPSVQFVIPHIKPRFDLSVPYGRTVYRALHADSTRFAEKFDLIVQAVQSVPRIKRLTLVEHHHRHRRDFLLGQETKQFDRLSWFLTLVDQRCSQIFNAKP